jgi:hypothetical protein
VVEYVERIRLKPGTNRHRLIEEVQWRRDPGTEPTTMAAAVLILLIERHGWDVRVRDGDHALAVRAVHPERGIAYLGLGRCVS